MWIEACISIVLPTELESRESVFVGGHPAAHRLVQIDKGSLNCKEDQCRFRRVFGYHERMSFSSRLIDESARLGDPVMFKVAPVACDGVAAHSTNVVVNAELRAGQALQEGAEAP